jgi:hypothetical protein
VAQLWGSQEGKWEAKLFDWNGPEISPKISKGDRPLTKIPRTELKPGEERIWGAMRYAETGHYVPVT